jgi:hypothetical protein
LGYQVENAERKKQLPRILYLAKLSITNKREIKMFPDKQKQRGFIASRPPYKKILKGSQQCSSVIESMLSKWEALGWERQRRVGGREAWREEGKKEGNAKESSYSFKEKAVDINSNAHESTAKLTT